MSDPTIPPTGTIIRAENGDVIGYDETGLTLRLSDKVIADIAARLDLAEAKPQTAAPAMTLPDLPEDLDLWAIRQQGDWIAFQANLPGADGARGYRRHAEGGAIVAEARGALFAILGIGGARAALASPGPGRFPYHVFGPADDIGAVGMGGDGDAQATALLQQLAELTHEALLAESLLVRRSEAHLSQPLFFVRAETDRATTAADLGTGSAMANLDRALANLTAAATRLGTRAQVLAVTLDYVLEDISGDPTAYRDGMIALMERITRSMAKHGLARPVFLSAFDCGTQSITHGPALDGQWELSWNHGDHQLVFTAPSYVFAIDDTGRLTDAGRLAKAEASATALLAVQDGQRWLCPTIQLAERDGSGIRLICEAMDALEIDAGDPFGAGPLAGFRLDGVTNGAKIKSVKIDPKDRKTVVLTCTKRPEGADLHVAYAHGADPTPGPYPANRGSLRDTSGEGGLYRWALPARLRVTDGAL
jgi:hypothetical protein